MSFYDEGSALCCGHPEERSDEGPALWFFLASLVTRHFSLVTGLLPRRGNPRIAGGTAPGKVLLESIYRTAIGLLFVRAWLQPCRKALVESKYLTAVGRRAASAQRHPLLLRIAVGFNLRNREHGEKSTPKGLTACPEGGNP